MLKRIIATLVALSSCHAFGWGAVGHEIIAYTGANITVDGQAFWQSNLEPIRQLTTVPDRIWKEPATKSGEGPNHWFQVDAYYTPANYSQIVQFPSAYSDAVTKYTQKTITLNGTAPWRIRQLYQMAVLSFKSGDMKSALQYAGAMSHYIGDISQPLHVSVDYDGQQTGNSGIHSYFETTIITDELAIRADVQTRAQKLLQDANFLNQFNGNLMDAVLLEIERSISYRDQVLKNDTQYGRTAQGAAIQLDLAKDRMADGAATLSLILNQLWKDTGLVANATPMTIQDPAWVQNNYNNLPEVRMTPIEQKFLADDEDCQAR